MVVALLSLVAGEIGVAGTIRQRPLSETEVAKVTWIDVQDASHFSPWVPKPITFTQFRLMKEYVAIDEYDADGHIDYTKRESYRLRVVDGNRLGLLHPDDDEEPNTPPPSASPIASTD